MTAAASPLHNRNIGFIGAGAMASAIIKGLLASGISPGRISASDPWEPARAKAKALGLNVTGNAEVAIVSEIIVVAVKPADVQNLIGDIADTAAQAESDSAEQVFVSVAAGVTTAFYENKLPAGAPVVRVMPNAPMLEN